MDIAGFDFRPLPGPLTNTANPAPTGIPNFAFPNSMFPPIFLPPIRILVTTSTSRPVIGILDIGAYETVIAGPLKGRFELGRSMRKDLFARTGGAVFFELESGKSFDVKGSVLSQFRKSTSAAE